MNTARHARKSLAVHGAGVTVKEVNYITVRIAQAEQYVNDRGRTFGFEGGPKMGKVTQFTRRLAEATIPTAPSISTHRVNGVDGDSFAADIADRVLAMSGSYANPSKNGWKLDPYQLAVAIIEQTSARWRRTFGATQCPQTLG